MIVAAVYDRRGRRSQSAATTWRKPDVSIAVEPIRIELAGVVREAQVVSEPAQCAAYAVDGIVPKYVIYPESADQVAAVLKWAADHGLAVIPCRNATKLGIGNPPRRYDIALSLKQMNNVWHYEPADLTISVESGMKFSDVQHFVDRHKLWLPLDPPAAARASIGGILATNSSGPLRLRYGAPREMVLGLKIATTEGKIIKTGGRVVKNVAGYDFSKLLIGSYGTLGVILEASFKLYPAPAERATFVLRPGSLEIARDLRRRILNSPLQPLRMVLLNGLASALVRNGAASALEANAQELWLEAGGSAQVIDRYARELANMGKAAGAVLERLEGAIAELFWTRISDFRTWVGESHPKALIMKASLPIASGEEFLGRTEQAAESERMRLASFGEAGVGVIHLCCLDEMSSAQTVTFVTGLRKITEKSGGTLVVERSSSDVKAGVDVWGTPGDDLGIMRKLKQAWDPKGILAPGRFAGSL